MPFLTVHTNVKLDKLQKEMFLHEAVEFVAAQLSRPKNYIIVTLDSNPDICIGGDLGAPCILAEMKSVGFKDKAGFARLLTEFLYTAIPADLNNINIEFTDLAAADVAIAGKLLG